MSDLIEKVKLAYKTCYADKMEGNEELKKAFWNGYMCKVVDEEMDVLRTMTEASKYLDSEVAEKISD